MDANEIFTKENILIFLAWVLFFAFLVHYLIEGLKKAGKVGDNQAGQVNELLSTLIGVGVFALRFYGEGALAIEAEELALALANSVVTILLTVLGANLWHQLVNLTRGVFARRPKVGPVLR